MELKKYEVEVNDNGNYFVMEISAASEEEALDEAERRLGLVSGTVQFTILG